MYLLPGILGFVFLLLFDLNKIYWKHRILNLFFLLGTVLLLFSTCYCVLQSDFAALFAHFGIADILLLLCLILSGAALIYVLFFALPFGNTYAQSDALPLVDRGVYGLCRHPGFWVLLLFYIFLTLFFSNIRLLYCLIAYSICNFLYIVVQDVYIFPRYIKGYPEYRKTVPFLLPTRRSLRNVFCKRHKEQRK